VFACLFLRRERGPQSHRLIQVRLREGPLQPRAAPIRCEAAAGSGPCKNAQTIRYTVPLDGETREAGGDVAGDRQAFPPATARLEPQQSRGDPPFASHPRSFVAGRNTKTLFLQACRIRFVFILLGPAAFLVVALQKSSRITTWICSTRVNKALECNRLYESVAHLCRAVALR